ncbi:MAG: hypothetical protein IJH84_28025, partial [Saccharopolyspora sp.]|uniref:hypothetical protein n=1 Tax=Saccharopolyspora sp. TaxID=33915 RepID=UPI0025E23A45
MAGAAVVDYGVFRGPASLPAVAGAAGEHRCAFGVAHRSGAAAGDRWQAHDRAHREQRTRHAVSSALASRG